jgi:hypothetical protein
MAEQRWQGGMTAHPDKHRKNKEHSRRITETEASKGWSRAIVDQPPTDAEQDCTENQRAIDLSPGG